MGQDSFTIRKVIVALLVLYVHKERGSFREQISAVFQAAVGEGDVVFSDKFRENVNELFHDVITDLQEAPTQEYYNLYHSLNSKLNEIVMAGEEFINIKKCYKKQVEIMSKKPALKLIYAENTLRFVHTRRNT